MTGTELKYNSDTNCWATLASISDYGSDDKGFFVIPDVTIFFGGSTSQQPDTGLISFGKHIAKILETASVNNALKHYLDLPIPGLKVGSVIAMSIFSDLRRLNSSINTVGLWITGIAIESLSLPLRPINNFQSSTSSFVEFAGLIELANNEVKDQINKIISANLCLPVKAVNVKDSRMVQIGGYTPRMCTGTPINAISEIKSARVVKIYNNDDNIRMEYAVEIWCCCGAG
ncbi:MAG: hypothetical protein U0T75_02020 [Chitinophagales bacterium]